MSAPTISSPSTPDATTTRKGKVKLAGDLSGTADLPTVPGLALKSNLNSPAFTGTPTAPTQSLGDNSTKLATTAYVDATAEGGVPDATTTIKGKIQLAGDLSGTAAAPTVPALVRLSTAVIYQGSWDNSIQYFPNDLVEYNGRLYLCLEENHSGVPNVQPTLWEPSIDDASIITALLIYIDVNNQKLNDASGQRSINWNSRTLLDNIGNTVLDYSSASVRTPNGSSGNPAYGFIDDGANDTGMYTQGDGYINWSTNGTPGMVLDPSQNLNISGNISAANFPILGNGMTVAGFDSGGNLISIPTWSYTTENGLFIGNNVDMIPQDVNDLTYNIDPSASTNTIYRSIYSFDTNLDPNNTGFSIGDATGGGVTLINTNLDRSSAGLSGNLTAYGGFSQIGDGTTVGTINTITGFNHGINLNANYTLNEYQGLSLFPNFEIGSTLGSSNMLQVGANYNGTTTGYAQSISLFPNFGPSSTTEHYHGIENSVYGNDTAFINEYINYNGYINHTHIGQLNGIQFSPDTITVDGNSQLINVNLSNSTLAGNVDFINVNGSSSTVAGRIQGININLNSINSTATGGDQQKAGITINDGTIDISSNWDTSIYGLPGGEWQHNELGGELHIAAGFPINDGSFGFGNNLGITVFAEDDYGIDATGIDLGFSINGLVNQLAVADGKTFHTLNYAMAGGGMSTGAGNIVNLSLFRALGFLPEGGAINITNLYGFKADAFLDAAGATNTYGIYVDASTAENYFNKSLVVGGVSKKVTNSNVAMEIADPKAFLPGRMDTTTRDAMTLVQGMMIFNTDTTKMEYYDGSTWIQT